MKRLFFLPFLMVAIIFTACNKNESDPQPDNAPSTVTKDKRLSGFTWTASAPAGNWLSSSFIDQNLGYIAGMGGAMIKTTDGGLSYASVTGLPAQDLYGCYFKNALEGFVVGNGNTALKTTDGGASWTALSLPASPTVGYRSIYFSNALTGFIGGGSGKVYKTTDGGLTWTLSNTGISSTHAIYAFLFFDANTGLACSSHGRMYRTTNGGASWTGSTVHDSRANMSSIYGYRVNAGPGFILDSAWVTTSIANSVSGDQTTYLVTHNGGVSWVKKTIAGSYQALACIKTFNSSKMYMAGGNVPNNTGVIFSQINHAPWTQEPIPAGTARLTTLAAYQYDFTWDDEKGVVFAAGLNNTVLKGE